MTDIVLLLIKRFFDFLSQSDMLFWRDISVVLAANGDEASKEVAEWITARYRKLT